MLLKVDLIYCAVERAQIRDDLIESKRVKIKSYIEDKNRQMLVISTEENAKLRKGLFYRLTIEFEGQLNENLNGFYTASYVDGDEKK